MFCWAVLYIAEEHLFFWSHSAQPGVHVPGLGITVDCRETQVFEFLI